MLHKKYIPFESVLWTAQNILPRLFPPASGYNYSDLSSGAHSRGATTSEHRETQMSFLAKPGWIQWDFGYRAEIQSAPSFNYETTVLLQPLS